MVIVELEITLFSQCNLVMPSNARIDIEMIMINIKAGSESMELDAVNKYRSSISVTLTRITTKKLYKFELKHSRINSRGKFFFFFFFSPKHEVQIHRGITTLSKPLSVVIH